MSGAEDGTWDLDVWDHVVDVVVVGTGVAGGAAAVAASRAGASVLMCDKAAEAGGTTARSGGGMWIPNNFSNRAKGLRDERDRMVRYMARSAFPDRYRPEAADMGLDPTTLAMIETFFDHASEVVDELVADGVVELDGFHFPDYYSDLEESVPWGHSLVPRLPADWQRGDPGGGHLLATWLREATEARGNVTLLGCRVVDLLRNDDGEVIGVEARHGRQTRLIGARRGVVFGSGGFIHDEELVREWLRGPVLGGAGSEQCTGDLVRIAIRNGAQLANMTQAWWTQVVAEQALRHRVTSRDVFYVYGDSMVVVNKLGRRVLNEKSPYTDRGPAHFYWDSGRHEYINRVLFMVYDDDVRASDLRADPGIRGSRMGRYPVPYPEEEAFWEVSAPDLPGLAVAVQKRLDELAPALGPVRLDDDFVPTLRRTIATYDEHARSGRDPDFRRGETLIEQAWSSRTRADALNDSLHPLSDEGPYHCVILGAGALDTKGGPRTDPDGRVLDAYGAPIPGFYAAGNCAASPTGQAYWGPGTTIGVALTFGYLAGRHAAGEPVRPGRLRID